MKLEDKVAIVTGAGSGIGNATARRLAEEGARLIVNDLREEYLDELVPSLSGEGHVAVAGDVSEEATAKELARTAQERFGRIDVLVNNVGDLFFKDITETSVEEWDRLMAVNLRSQFLCCKRVIPAMQEQRSGSIINLSSISAFIGQEMGGQSSFAYNVTKAGARQLATSLATRYAAEGIRVNAVIPGVTRTKQIRHFVPDLPKNRRTRSGRPPAPRAPHGPGGAPRGDRGGHRVPGLRRCLLRHRGRVPRGRRLPRALKWTRTITRADCLARLRRASRRRPAMW